MKIIYTIIVTFNPDICQIHNTFLSIVNQVNKILIVKNSDEILNFGNGYEDKVHIIQLEKNMGIAYAQNRGIEYAISQGADYILFSDQDTIYPANFIEIALQCVNRHKYEKIAGIVPLFYNQNKKVNSKIFVKKNKAINVDVGRDYSVTHAISSGTLCPIKVFSDIGLMNEKLFIDFVDYEWCWRAKKMGYQIICDTQNLINHNMGDSYKVVFGRKIVMYSSFRNYYFFRNSYYLLFHSKLFTISEWIKFYGFILLKKCLFFITNGFFLKNIKLIIVATDNGIRNNLCDYIDSKI